MEVYTSADACSRLWRVMDMDRLSFGVTGSFEFRSFYSALVGQTPYFVCDQYDHPSYLLPLAKGAHGFEWFGSNELEDPPIVCPVGAERVFLKALQAHSSGFAKIVINERQYLELQRGGLVASSEVCGRKVLVKTTESLMGHSHWSPRNLQRARHAFPAQTTHWQIYDHPTQDQLLAVFEASVAFFAQRNKHSKLNEQKRREKYEKIYLTDIPGVTQGIAICYVEGRPALYALFILCAGVITISTVSPVINHSEGVRIQRYGFRYAISSLPEVFNEYYGNLLIDFQGGAHSWKQEVDGQFQLPQFNIQFAYGCI